MTELARGDDPPEPPGCAADPPDLIGRAVSGPAGLPGRASISWSELRGARVGVWGVGREGMASLRKLRSLGVEPVLVDDSPPPGDEHVLATAEGGLEALLGCEVVVKTPG